jgi:ribosomal protein S14
MSLQTRLGKLEAACGVSDGAECNCPTLNRDIRTYMGEEDNHATADADERPPEVCERCGKPMGIIKLVLIHSRDQVRA